MVENGGFRVLIKIGKIEIQKKASVWFGATLRGDNEEILIGEGSNIQENCVLHTDHGFPLKIQTNCTIGHSVILHGCSIADNTLIGMGSTILNGAQIGNLNRHTHTFSGSGSDTVTVSTMSPYYALCYIMKS